MDKINTSKKRHEFILKICNVKCKICDFQNYTLRNVKINQLLCIKLAKKIMLIYYNNKLLFLKLRKERVFYEY